MHATHLARQFHCHFQSLDQNVVFNNVGKFRVLDWFFGWFAGTKNCILLESELQLDHGIHPMLELHLEPKQGCWDG
jgi:hypothetical protein